MSPNLKFIKKGSCEEIVRVCREIGSALEDVKPEDLEDNVTKKDIERLKEEWGGWRPLSEDEFSDEMKEKTAEQSSIDESTLEKEGKEATEEIKNAGDSIKEAANEAKEKGFDEAKDQISNAVKCAGRAVDSGLRKGIRSVEENVYENVILKTNDFYFDNNLLSAVVSENIRGDSEEEYELTLHSNNPRLREFFAERIEWDES